MRKFILFFIPVYLFLFSVLNAQQDEWKSYLNSESIQAIAEEQNTLWMATAGGFVKYDKLTGISTTFSKTNSSLPYNYVHCVAVDQKGNKWIGTWGGAAKFDGTDWEVFTAANSALPSNIVYGIAFDKLGNTWFATMRGLAKYDGANWTVFSKENVPEITENNFRCVAADAAGNVWAGTSSDYYQQGGLFKYDGSKWTAYTQQNSSIPDYVIKSIVFGKNSEVWLGTDNSGLVKFDGSGFTTYNQNNSNISDIRIRGLSIDNNNNLWIACEQYLKKGGISKFDGTNFTNYTSDAGSYPVPSSTAILASGDGKIYSGAQYKGLAVFNGSKWNSLKVSDCGLPSNFVHCIVIDSKDNKWIGTDEAGLAKYDGVNWTVYDTTTSIKLPHNAVLSLAEDHDGVIWAGTRNGIVKISGNNYEVFNARSANPVYAEWVQQIIVDKNNNKWFACDSGLLKYDGREWVHYGPQSIPVMPNYLSNFMCVFEDASSNIWAGVNGFGVLKFDGTNWTAFSPSNSAMTYADIESISQDKNGNIWAGAFGQSPDGNNGGMFIYNGTAWENKRQNNSPLPGNYINSIESSPSGELWIGATHYGTSFGGGLAVYDGVSNWTVMTPENSKLPYAWIKSIKFDKKGNAWLGIYGYGVAVYKKGGIVSVGDETTATEPEDFRLAQNYPNPFNPSTVISYQLPAASNVTLKVYDILGNEVASLVNEFQQAGIQYSVFNIQNYKLASGVYLYKIQAGSFNAVKKMILLK